MGICAYVRCPRCRQDFVVSPSLLSVEGIKAHCPFCDASFPPEESPRIVGWKKETAGLGVAGALRD
ncbi:MAG: zinc-ribbon domain-containing protein [Chloroflexi bacterium]|nr:zinc-ribbon domain-containing protein [Chloroflexota bacterium]